jgi:uncharacterized RDD family membrane protein YckC
VEGEKCAQCGTPAVSDAKFCESCGAPLAAASQPVEGPAMTQPAPTYAAQGAEMQYQGVGIRFVAILIDGIILGIIGSILFALFGGSAITVDQVTNTATITSTYWAILALELVIVFLYFTLLEGHGGQTVGKMVVKLRVVREADGSPIDYGAAAVRTILRIIDGIFIYLIGAILIWSSDKKQRLGDRVAHTIVVRAQ